MLLVTPLLLLALFARRDLLLSIPSSITITNNIIAPQSIHADDTSSELYLARPIGTAKNGENGTIKRPSAPLAYLLPAARVGVYIYQTLNVARDIVSSHEDDNNALRQKINKLEKLLIDPPSFVKANDPSVTRGDPYNLPPIVGEIAMQRQKQKEREQNSIQVGTIPEVFEVGQLIGERRAWDRLSKSELIRESQSEVRRALNIYTTNINFNSSVYAFAGSTEEKRRLIREEKLPTVNDVIRSDLDARDLYRNEIQTALDDAKAEFLYQQRICSNDVSKFDAEELVLLLSTAKRAMDSWFSFVPDQDIMKVLDMVNSE